MRNPSEKMYENLSYAVVRSVFIPSLIIIHLNIPTFMGFSMSSLSSTQFYLNHYLV